MGRRPVLWLGELVGVMLWHLTEDYWQFLGAMIVMICTVFRTTIPTMRHLLLLAVVTLGLAPSVAAQGTVMPVRAMSFVCHGE